MVDFSKYLKRPTIVNDTVIKKVYIDEETTGTDPLRHGMIQIAMHNYFGREQADQPIVLKLQPFPNDVIEDSALEVNGITREELFSPDRLEPKVGYKIITGYLARRIDKFNRNDKAMFCGYRAQFDSDFLREFMRKCGDDYYGSWFWTPPLCSFMLAGYLLQQWRHILPNFKLRTVYEFLHPEEKSKWTEDDWHDALFDIQRTIDVEAKLRLVAAGKWKPDGQLF